MELIKTVLLFLVLKIKEDRHLLHKFNFQQQPGRMVVPSREEVNSFGSIVSQCTELEAPCQNKECKGTGKIPG